MYIIKEYLTGNTVAVASRKEDALAMMRSSSHKDDPKLIVEKMQKPVDTVAIMCYSKCIGQTNTKGRL